MGVMNVTPDSFSDGGDLTSLDLFSEKLESFGTIDALDIGAESTAPKNKSISEEEEWERLKIFLPMLRTLNSALSIDSYKPETVFKVVRWWKDNKLHFPLIWNDVSGKFDEAANEFLKAYPSFRYVFCHNLAPSRELTSKHMDFVSEELNLRDYFLPHKKENVIFDPCLGFSKTYEQNWWILENFGELQRDIDWNHWLIGFSRKSFLQKKSGLSLSGKEALDRFHVEELKRLSDDWSGEVYVRTHRPELL